MKEYFCGKYSYVKNNPLDVLSLAEIKSYIGMPASITSKDAELTLLLSSAIDQFMKFTQMGLLDTTYTCDLYGFSNIKYYYDIQESSASFTLFRQKIHTINFVKYYKNNVLTTVNPTDYKIDFKNFTTDIISASSNGFPDDYDTWELQNKPGAVKIEFVSGFGATSNDIPPDVKQGILSYIMFAYNNKGDCSCDSGNMQAQFMNLISEYKYVNPINGL